MGKHQRLSRRAFLQRTGTAMAALGLTEWALETGMTPQARAYSQAIAQSAGRKLALLIGIDAYPAATVPPDQPGNGRLAGCTTDVALQRELLIHRFGFLPEDVLSLTDARATRTGIYQAFIDHLYNQAGPGDVVVFHFSGFGAQVRQSDLAGGQLTRRSLVPFDGRLPTESRPALNDISEVELKALLKQLKTKQVTTVIDAGFVDIAAPLSGGLRSRTRSAIATGKPPAPFPLLANKRFGLGLPKENTPFPGLLLRGAGVDEVVLERQWRGFNAGAFTYILTQYLWSAPAPVTVGPAIGQSQEALLRWGGSDQQPTVSGNRARTLDKNPPLFDTPLFDNTRGEGIVTEVSTDGKRATLWLGGLPPRVLEYLNSQTVVACGDKRLTVRSRDGLTAKAVLAEAPSNDDPPLQPGQPVVEAVRVLPKSIDLVVALDSRLERIERVDATSALSALAFVSSTSDTELPADCLLAKPLDDRAATLTASLHPVQLAQTPAANLTTQETDTLAASESADNSPNNSSTPKADPTRSATPQSVTPSADNTSEDTPEDIEPQGVTGYGLFSLMRSPIPGTLALQDEAIKPAINRLTPKLQSLLALKMLRLSENQTSSQLPARVTLEMVSPQEKLLLQRQTLPRRPASNSPTSNSPLENAAEKRMLSKATAGLPFIPEIPIGSRVRYRLYNDGDAPIYYTLIAVDARERLSAFCPAVNLSAPMGSTENSDKSAAAASIAPGSSVTVPSIEADWPVEAPTGPVETYVACSLFPLTRTLDALAAEAIRVGGQRISPVPQPLEVVEALLADMSQNDGDDAYALDVSQWATFNFTYRTA